MFKFGNAVKWSMAIDGLPAADRELVESSCIRRKYKAGQIVYAAGDPGRSVVIVESGRLRGFQIDAEGQEVTLCVLSSGHCTGLTSAISSARRPISIAASEDSIVLDLERSKLMDLMQRLPSFSMGVTTLLAAVAQEAVENSSWFVANTATQRLAHTLLALLDGCQSAEGGNSRVLNGIRHDELASMVGVSRTWISLTLASLEEEGLIRRSRSRIEVVDEHKLQTYSGHRSPHCDTGVLR